MLTFTLLKAVPEGGGERGRSFVLFNIIFSWLKCTKSQVAVPLQEQARRRGHSHVDTRLPTPPARDSPMGFAGFSSKDYCQVQKAALCSVGIPTPPPPRDLTVIYRPCGHWPGPGRRWVGVGGQRLVRPAPQGDNPTLTPLCDSVEIGGDLHPEELRPAGRSGFVD